MTKQQIFDAALKYAQEQNPGRSKASIEPDCDFIAGAMWAADEMEAEISDLKLAYTLRKGMSHKYGSEVMRLQAENARLREALEEIIDRYEVANMLAGNDPVIEKAKSVL